jgi:hypothetical protein
VFHPADERDEWSRSSATSLFEAGETMRVTILVAILVLAGAAHAGAQQPRWQIGSTPSFSTGAYGTDSRTEILYTAFTVRRLFDSGDLTVVVPMACIRGEGSVTIIGGSPVQTRQVETTPPTRPGATRPTSPPTTPTTTTTTVRTATCGAGDVIARGRYYVTDEADHGATIALRTHLKLPTASAARGLGTGRPDEGIGLEVSRSIAGGLLAMVDGGYTFIGDTTDLPLENRWWYDIGLSQRIGRGVDLAAFFEEHGAIVQGNSSARDVLVVLSITAPGGWRWQLSGEVGLSDGAPDHGFTFGASRRF